MISPRIKQIIKSIALIQLVLFIFLLSCSPDKRDIDDHRATNKLIHLLNLNLVDSDNVFGKSLNYIKDDTIYGYKYNFNHADSTFFFYKKLDFNQEYYVVYPSKCITKGIERPDILKSPVLHLTYFKNHTFYFRSSGMDYLELFSANGEIKPLLFGSRNMMWVLNKVMFYKDYLIVKSMNGVFIYNEKFDSLVWHHKYLHKPNYMGKQKIVGDEFIFTEHPYKKGEKSMIYCLNLKTLKLMWKKEINEEITGGGELDLVSNDSNLIAIPTHTKIFILETNSGKSVHEIKIEDKKKAGWTDSFFYHDLYYYLPIYNLDDKDRGIDKDTTYSFDLKNHTIKWKENCRLYYLKHSNKFITLSQNTAAVRNLPQNSIIDTIMINGNIALKNEGNYFTLKNKIYK